MEIIIFFNPFAVLKMSDIHLRRYRYSPGTGSHRLEFLGKVFLVMVIGSSYLYIPNECDGLV